MSLVRDYIKQTTIYKKEYGKKNNNTDASRGVLRKMYETSILTGDVINKNKRLNVA